MDRHVFRPPVGGKTAGLRPEETVLLGSLDEQRELAISFE